MGMKFIEKGAKNCGGLAELHRKIVRRGVNVTQDALGKSIREKREGMNLGTLSAIVHEGFGGNWAAVGKLIDEEFGTKK